MDFDYGVLFTSEAMTMLGKGLWFTLQLTVLALIGGMLIGTPLAMMRLSSNRWLSGFAKLYVDFFRGLPLVQVLLVFYLMMPLVIQWVTGSQYPKPLGALVAGVITFAIFEAAYYSEIMRAGIQSISRGQQSASYALGMSYGQTMAQVILPQALRNMLPVLLTQTIILFQDTSLVYAIGAYDLLKGFTTAGKIYGRPEEAYILAAIVYFVICYALSYLVKKLQAKIAIIR